MIRFGSIAPILLVEETRGTAVSLSKHWLWILVENGIRLKT
ncbi:hypothetical protein [Methylomonas albis]|nr:hypothetical protein [Methylomonas albis]